MKLEEIIEVIESFDYESEISWRPVANGLEGQFSVDNNSFIIRIREATEEERRTYRLFSKDLIGRKVGNLDFSFIDSEGSETQDATNIMGIDAVKVLSTVAHGAIDVFRSHNYDIMLFIAKQSSSPTNFNRRKSIYIRMSDILSRKGRIYTTTLINRPNLMVNVAVKGDLVSIINRLITHLNSQTHIGP